MNPTHTTKKEEEDISHVATIAVTVATCHNDHVARCSKKDEKASWTRVFSTHGNIAACNRSTWPCRNVY